MILAIIVTDLIAGLNGRKTVVCMVVYNFVLERCCKGSAFFANMQALCVFAHAVEVSMRENQRIRQQIVHGDWLYV